MLSYSKRRKMSQIKVFGHKAPDTDTVGSAIIFAWYLTEVKKLEAVPYRLGDLNKETKFVLSNWGFEIPELLDELKDGDQVAIVDTNNPGELPESLEKADIIEIVDHHKLAGLITSKPLTINIRPMACTASIIYCMSQKNNIEMPDNIKQLVLSCIISDTLMFRSPTTTDKDKAYAEEIAEELGIEIEPLANEMFDNKSDLTGMSAEDLLNVDSKLIEIGGKQVKVSVMETTKPDNALEMKAELIALMKEYKANKKADEVFFFAIDILNEEATAVVNSEEAKDWIEKAFNLSVTGDTVVIPGVVSRKKQIIPNLSK